MSQAWTLSIVERVARKAACPAHGDTLRVCTRPRVAEEEKQRTEQQSELHWCNPRIPESPTAAGRPSRA